MSFAGKVPSSPQDQPRRTCCADVSREDFEIQQIKTSGETERILASFKQRRDRDGVGDGDRAGHIGRAGPLSPGLGFPGLVLSWAVGSLAAFAPATLWPSSQWASGHCSSSDFTAQQTVMSWAVLIFNGSLKFWPHPSTHTAISAECFNSRSKT